MEKVQVLIHAAGGETRWRSQIPKQLAHVCGETILGKLVRHCRERGYEPTIVSRDSRKTALGTRYLVPERSEYHIETLWSSKEIWGERTVVLFGDTLYESQRLSRILITDEPFAFFGDAAQLFALTFTDRARIQKALEELLKGIEQHRHGRLLDLYRHLAGIPLGENRIGPHYVMVEDYWTLDIDSIEEYRTLISRLRGTDPWG